MPASEAAIRELLSSATSLHAAVIEYESIEKESNQGAQ